MSQPRAISVEPFRVAVFGGDATVRGLLIERLTAAVGIVVVGQAESASDGVTGLVGVDPEVVVVDVSADDEPGDVVCHRLRRAGLRVGCVMLTAFPGSVLGPVDGVALKQVTGDGLEREIRRVGAGIRAIGHD